MTLEQQINQSYSKLGQANRRIQEINMTNLDQLPRPAAAQLRIERERCKVAMDEAKLDIERLKLIIQARMVEHWRSEVPQLIVARNKVDAQAYARRNHIPVWRYANPPMMLGLTGYNVVWLPGCDRNTKFDKVREIIEGLMPDYLSGQRYEVWKGSDA